MDQAKHGRKLPNKNNFTPSFLYFQRKIFYMLFMWLVIEVWSETKNTNFISFITPNMPWLQNKKHTSTEHKKISVTKISLSFENCNVNYNLSHPLNEWWSSSSSVIVTDDHRINQMFSVRRPSVHLDLYLSLRDNEGIHKVPVEQTSG